MALAPGLIIEDAVIEISDGGAYTGQAVGGITWGTALQYICGVRRLEVETEVDEVDVSGGCGGTKIFRYGKHTGMMRIQGLVNLDGSFNVYGTATPEGRIFKVRTKTLSSLGTYITWYVVIRRWTWATDSGQAQAENVEARIIG